MSTEEEQFWQVVESFIQQANNAAENVDTGIVLSALLEAGARYSAFFAASGTEDRNEFKAEVEATVQDFSVEYKKRLQQNVDDYLENYKIYMKDVDA